MDSTENSHSDSLKSEEFVPSKANSSPPPEAKPYRLHQESVSWSSKTPEKPVDPPRRDRNRGAEISLKGIIEKPDPVLAEQIPSSPVAIEKSDPLVVGQIPSSPVAKPEGPDDSTNLPESYEMLDKLFRSLDNSIRLCRMKRSAATFGNVSPKMQCLSGRRFTYKHLAQIKFILPDAIEIKKILVHDVRTSCMKPELLLSLDVKAVEDSENAEFESANIMLRKLFRSRLVDYLKAHPQDDEIPEEDLPEPFNALKTADQTNTATIQESSASTETQENAPSENKPLDLSHMSQSFRSSFSQKGLTMETEQEEVVPSGEPSCSEMIPKTQCSLPEIVIPIPIPTPNPTPKELTAFATPVKDADSNMISANTSVATPVQSDFTPAKLAIPIPSPTPKNLTAFATPVKHSDSNMISASTPVATPVQSDCTPAKLASATPGLAPPKRCYMTPDNDDVKKSGSELVGRPPRSRSLNFDYTIGKDPEDDGENKDSVSVDDNIFNVLPENAILSNQVKETEARKQMIAGLPKLFDIVYFLFQSTKRSVVTKEELLHKVVSINLDIVDRKEAEEQLRLLQELAPEWIYEKMASSRDCLMCVNKISSPDVIRARLTEAI